MKLPDNWERLGVIAQHQWLKSNAGNFPPKQAAPAVKMPPESKSQSSLQEQYFYYSTMIKTDEQSLKNIPDHN